MTNSRSGWAITRLWTNSNRRFELTWRNTSKNTLRKRCVTSSWNGLKTITNSRSRNSSSSILTHRRTGSTIVDEGQIKPDDYRTKYLDPNGRRADESGRTRLRHLFATAQGQHHLYRYAD